MMRLQQPIIARTIFLDRPLMRDGKRGLVLVVEIEDVEHQIRLSAINHAMFKSVKRRKLQALTDTMPPSVTLLRHKKRKGKKRYFYASDLSEMIYWAESAQARWLDQLSYILQEVR